jgi:hypothetical protein
VLAAFDIDIITTGIDIKTKKTMSLRESTGNSFWNKWNMALLSNKWDVKRILDNSNVVLNTQREFDTTDIVDKYSLS